MKIIYTAVAALVVSAFMSASPAHAWNSKPVITHHQPPPPVCKVAEPATLILLGSALSGLGLAKRFKKD